MPIEREAQVEEDEREMDEAGLVMEESCRIDCISRRSLIMRSYVMSWLIW